MLYFNLPPPSNRCLLMLMCVYPGESVRSEETTTQALLYTYTENTLTYVHICILVDQNISTQTHVHTSTLHTKAAVHQHTTLLVQITHTRVASTHLRHIL